MLKAFKYRLYPTEEQKLQPSAHFGCVRYIWNWALALKKEAYEKEKQNISRFTLQKLMVDQKQEKEWLYEVNAQSLQGALLNLDNAYKNFFNGGGFPKFKCKHDKQSFQCPQNCSVNDGRLSIPKIKNIKVELSRPIEGEIKTVTISKTVTGKYYASILTENGIELPSKPEVNPESTIGIDMGIKSFVISSDGRSFVANRFLKKNLDRLKILQRRASKKQKGSSNRKKANLRVSRLHEYISNSRIDFIHKTTTCLVRDSQTDSIVIEDLNVSGMLKNHKLAQAITDVSWRKFFEILRYKCNWYGVNVIVIDRFAPSSKRCGHCGNIYKELSLSEREWTCAECKTTHDRDLNAANNIRWFGLNAKNFQENTPEGIREEPVEQRRMRRAKKQESSHEPIPISRE